MIARSIQSVETQSLTGVVLSDVRVNVLRELGGLLAVRTLVLGRHAALVTQMPRHILLESEAVVAARAVVILVYGVYASPLPGGPLPGT